MMIPERDYLLAKAEMKARQEAAAEERRAREARREAAARAAAEPCGPEAKEPHGAFGWLRRLAGVR